MDLCICVYDVIQKGKQWHVLTGVTEMVEIPGVFGFVFNNKAVFIYNCKYGPIICFFLLQSR